MEKGTVKKEYLVSKNNLVYDLTVESRICGEETNFEIIIEQEYEFEYFYKFSGTLTNLIDHDKRWKKFDDHEIIDLMDYNYTNKMLEIEVEKEIITLKIKYNVNGIEIQIPIILTKLIKPEPILNKCGDDQLISVILKLKRDLKKLQVKKVQVLNIIYDKSYKALNENKEFAFDLELKNSANVEFISLFSINCNKDSYLTASLQYENTSTSELLKTLIYNCRYYNRYDTDRWRVIENPVEVKFIQRLNKGIYKMKFLFDTNDKDNAYKLNFLRVFCKIRNI
jgi:hypothetical protein